MVGSAQATSRYEEHSKGSDGRTDAYVQESAK